MDIQEKLEIRRQYRRTLIATKDTIRNLNTCHIDPEEAEKVGILQAPLSLDGDSPDRPIFFTPYEADLSNLEELNDVEDYPDHDPETGDHVNVYGLCLYMNGHTDEIMLHYPPGIRSIR